MGDGKGRMEGLLVCACVLCECLTLFMPSLSEPALTRYSTTFTWPLREAKWRGLSPYYREREKERGHKRKRGHEEKATIKSKYMKERTSEGNTKTSITYTGQSIRTIQGGDFCKGIEERNRLLQFQDQDRMGDKNGCGEDPLY